MLELTNSGRVANVCMHYYARDNHKIPWMNVVHQEHL